MRTVLPNSFSPTSISFCLITVVLSVKLKHQWKKQKLLLLKKGSDIFWKCSKANEEINMKGTDPCGDFGKVSSARKNNSIVPDVISAQT